MGALASLSFNRTARSMASEAASQSGGAEAQQATLVRFVGGSTVLYDPRKLQEGRQGEDAVFVNRWAAGVADGVGGWADHGVDAGVYAR